MWWRRRRAETERAHAERLAWEEFRTALAGVRTLAEASTLAGRPPSDVAGAAFHVNLAYLVNALAPPPAASHAELAAYVVLMRRAAAGGEVRPGQARALLLDLAAALDRPPFAPPG